MDKTRCLFVLNGEKDVVAPVLREINHFEAITSTEMENISWVQRNNKSAAVYSDIRIEPDVRKGTIRIMVGNDLDGEDTIDVKKENIAGQFKQIAAHHGVDIGDYISDEKCPQPTKEDCFLCKILERQKDPHLPSMDTVLYESKYFYVIPAKGAIVPGYVMIVPKEHVWSSAQLGAEEMSEMLEMIEDVKYLLQKIYKKKILIFEHGSGNEGKCKHKKSIVHAHIHLVPTDMQMSKDEMESILLKKISYDDLQSFANDPYFLYIDHENEWYMVSDPEVYIPRQYARQLLAAHEGISGELWNWRTYSFTEYIEDTVQDIDDYLRSNYHLLPMRKRAMGFLKRMENNQ